jgi:hypothetical protein
MRDWRGTGGFSIDASVRIEGHDRHGIERLIRYCARPPFALNRLDAPDGIASLASPEARLIYRLPVRESRESAERRLPSTLLLTPLELLQRIARLIPPPRIHRHRYHGVLAPNARLRARVTAIGRPEPDDASPDDPVASVEIQPAQPETADSAAIEGPTRIDCGARERPSSSRRIRWAQLLARIFEVLPLLCPACGGSMTIIAFLTDPPVVRAILRQLDLPHRPPPLSPARAPPQADIFFDQSLPSDLSEAQSIPDFVFDQSTPPDWDLLPDGPGGPDAAGDEGDPEADGSTRY